MTINRSPRTAEDFLNKIDKRLDTLERKGRGFTIPPAVGSGSLTIAQDEPPPAPQEPGTIWIDTDDGNKVYIWDTATETWLPTMDPNVDIQRNNAAIELALRQDDEAASDGTVRFFHQATAPTATGIGDLWVDTDTLALYRWSGASWLDQDDVILGALYASPALSTTIADGQVRTWWQFSEPTAVGFGDVWVNTSVTPPTLFRWNNFDWLQVTDWGAVLANRDLATKITSFYQDEPPTATAVGDIWFDTNDANKVYRWDGTTWEPGDDGRIDQALIDAAAAQATADTKITTFYQTSPPTSTAVGDLWVDIDDGNRLYRANAIGVSTIVSSGDGWYSVRDSGIAAASAAAAAAMDAADDALTAAEAAQATADGAIRTWYQADAPTGLNNTTDLGDLWFDTDDNQAYRWNGSTWVVIEDNSIAAALAAAENAQTTADGKITAFYATTAPVTGMSTGDLWYDTDNDNRVSYYNGSAWIGLPLGNAAIADGAITAPKLDLNPGDLDGIVDVGPDGNPPASAPTVSWKGGIGSIFVEWERVSNADPVTYQVFIREAVDPTTADDTYLAGEVSGTLLTVREAIGPTSPEDPTEIKKPVVAGTDYKIIVRATDADGNGPNAAAVTAQPMQITGPDIAVNAVTTDHLAANSVTAEEIAAGSVRAEALEANMILSSRIDVGEIDTIGLNPDEQNPNLLPALLSSDAGLSSITAGSWWPQVSGGSTWTYSPQEFNLESADPLWQRLHTGVFPGFKLTNTGAAITGSTSAFLNLDTVVTVEADTEYRLSLGSAFPGSTSVSSAVVADAHVNAVKVYLSTSSSFPVGGVASWKSNSIDLTPNPEFVQWDDGLIRTATGQTTLYVRVRIDTHYIAANGSAWIVDPTLRKVVSDKTLQSPTSSDAVTAVASTVPTASTTAWGVRAEWVSGTPTTSTGLYTTAAGAFSPSLLSTPGRYQRPDQGTFMAARGARVTSRSSAASAATFSAVTPTVAVPTPGATGANTSHYLEIGFQHVSIASNYLVEAYFFDAADALIGSAVTLGTGAPAAWGINSLTENLFAFRLDSGDLGVVPDSAVKAAFRVVCTTTAGVAATDYTFGLHSPRFYSLVDVNPNYGQVEQQHLSMDRQGIRLTNEFGQIQVNIPTDSEATPVFKGDIEAGGLRVLGGATFESAENEIAKDSILSLSDGIKSPTGTPALVQEYEQYTLQRQPPAGQHPGFSTIPTLNPAQITGMVWKSEWNEFWIMENRGGGAALWRFSSGGTCKWAGLQTGWQNAVPMEDTRGTPGVSDNIYAGEFGGIHWAQVYNGSGAVVFNKFPAGVVPDNVEPAYTWNQTNNKLYVWYPHVDGSGRNVYKRLATTATNNGTMTLEETVVGGAGTSRSSYNTGLAGGVAIGANLYTAARGTTSADVYAFASGAGGALSSGSRWELAAPPVGFCHDGTTFWQVDTSGKLTRYSTWTWTETNHKLYAGMTWYDSDAGGTGTHETNLTTLSSVTLKKRISGIRVTMPQTPDKGGSDDPNKWRLYAFKGASIALPGGRTSMFLQSEGGSSSSQSTYVIPANGLVTTGTNPPAANNFPGAGAGKVISAAVDGSSNPLIDLRGDGTYTLGQLSTKTGRMATWVMSGGTSIAANTYVPDPGGYTSIVGDYTANDGWVGISYSGGGVFTCTEKGLYQFEVGFNFASAANTRRWTLAWLNESTFDDTTCYRMHAEASLNGNHQAILRFDIKLAVGDAVRAGWRQDSAGSLSATATQGFKIGGTMQSRYMQILRKA